jgi:nitroreductase
MPRLTDVQFHAAVELAVRAPSLHNSQPWRFRSTGDAVELSADAARQLPVADPTGRAVRIACGAALLNLRLALAAQGLSTETTLLPDTTHPELLARIDVGPARPASPGEAALAAAIPRRHSQRAPFVEAVVPPTHRNTLTSAAQRESAALTLVTDRAVAADVADLIQGANKALANTPGYLDELRSWTRTDDKATDGVPRRAGGPAPAPHEQLTRRDFGGAPAPDHRRYEGEPLLAVLCSHGDSPRDQLIAGQALQRVLLAATAEGLVASMLSQPIEVPDAREKLRITIKSVMEPQMVLRIGFGTPGVATPRRDITEVIDTPQQVPRD